jgi:hypothetical protein
MRSQVPSKHVLQSVVAKDMMQSQDAGKAQSYTSMYSKMPVGRQLHQLRHSNLHLVHIQSVLHMRSLQAVTMCTHAHAGPFVR